MATYCVILTLEKVVGDSLEELSSELVDLNYGTGLTKALAMAAAVRVLNDVGDDFNFVSVNVVSEGV